MTAQKGKDLLLKVDSDGAGSFTTVAGLRARNLAFNAASVDITDQESTGRWRELLEGAGIKTARRGFPHVPGNDFMLSVASRQGKNDGKSRFK